MKELIRKNYYLKAFVIGILTAFCLFIPYITVDRGFFTYAGDFNSQQIPFYMYMVRMVKSGSLNWGWAIDLGSSVINSYSFYLLGSPFFWLACLFPYKMIPYLMPFLLMLKFAVGSTGAFGYLRRYAKSDNYAIVGAMLYTFSGFSLYNIFFNHFIESVIYFPYLLWALDEFMYEKKRGIFPLIVAISLVNNYFFFIGQVVFLFIYFIVKWSVKEYQTNLKEFFSLAFESVLGCLMGIVLFIPSAVSVIQNPRVSRTLSGFGIWLYSNVQQYFAILSSALLPPDPPYVPALFTQGSIKWTSMSAFVAFGGLFGFFIFKKVRNNSSFYKIFLISIICAFVPVFNSMFYAFNSSYYARWYYMPVLMLVAMNMQSFAMDKKDIVYGLKTTAILTAVLLVFGLTPVEKEDGGLFIGLASEVAMYWLNVLVAFLSLYLVYYTVTNYRDKSDYTKKLMSGTLIMIMLSGIIHLGLTKMPQYEADSLYKPQNYDILDSYDFGFSDTKDFRIDTFNCFDNLGLYTGIPCIEFFNSTVSPSIMEFYPSVGVERNVSSKPRANLYALRSLLSVRYLVMPQWETTNYESAGNVLNWSEIGSAYPYTVYESNFFIPMGFAYNLYTTEESLSELIPANRRNVMLRAIVLSEEDANHYRDILDKLPDSAVRDATYRTYVSDVEERQNMSSYFFEMNDDGFECKISLPEENLVFFSVPYDEGFTAKVNGYDAEILKVNYGMMAVPVHKGNNDIIFTYRTPYLREGFLVSTIGISVYFAYLGYVKISKNKASETDDVKNTDTK